MALKPCRECKKEVAQLATRCPHCGVNNPAASPAARAFGAVFSIALLSFGAWYLLGGGLEAKVAQDLVEQYEMAQRTGDTMQMCVHAGIVSAAYMQAGDDENYAKWQRMERRDCGAAGVPR